MARFFHQTLRTTDVGAARAFYAAVLGPNDAEIVQLHEQALARGAPPHWLGHLDVKDVDAAVLAFGARGATALSPKWLNPAGLEAAVIRDPGGAVLALSKPPSSLGNVATRGPDIVWHVLNTVDVERAKTNYRELFGWEFQAPFGLGTLGVLHPFAWQTGGAPVGVLIDVAGRPGVHPHWLFHFRVAALDAALDAVRTGGGLVIGPTTLPSRARVAVCDDPQGAAFALFEARS